MGAGPCATQLAPLRFSAAWIVIVSSAGAAVADSLAGDGGSLPAQPSASNPATNANRRLPRLCTLFRFTVAVALVMFDLRAATLAPKVFAGPTQIPAKLVAILAQTR